jgi:hypothetical protein
MQLATDLPALSPIKWAGGSDVVPTDTVEGRPLTSLAPDFINTLRLLGHEPVCQPGVKRSVPHATCGLQRVTCPMQLATREFRADLDQV